MLTDSVVKIVADAPLFAIADFENFAFKALAFGDVASDAFDLKFAILPLNQARADFQFNAFSWKPRRRPIPCRTLSRLSANGLTTAGPSRAALR